MREERTPLWKRTEVILGSAAASIAAVAGMIIDFSEVCEVLLPGVCPPSNGNNGNPPTTVTGRWIDTTIERANRFSPDTIHLFQNGTEVHGNYEANDNGKIVRGNLRDNRHLKAIWVEDNSRQECTREIEGSRHWGHVEINFDNSLQNFDGLWEYCDVNPSKTFYGRRAH